jgi:catechol 2,3-dioxygenase-like lactoylglutathione lyase family enzyme
MTPPVTRLLETSLYVDDLDISAAFYGRVFGFTVLLRDRRMCAMEVPGRQVLLLFRRGGSVEASATPFGTVPAHDGAGVLHLCFAIAMPDIQAWRTHLREQDVRIESEIGWPRGGISLYFRDPDGTSVEVATPGLWQNDPLTER